ARQDIDTYVSLSGTSSSYSSRADFLIDLKDYAAALKDFDEALRIDPKGIYVYIARARFYRLTGQYDLAQEEYAKLIKIDSRYSYAYWGRAKLYKAKGLYQQAIDDLETAMKIDTAYRSIFNTSIWSPLIRSGQFDKAKEYVDEYLSQTTSSPDLDYNKFYKPYLAVIATNLPALQYDEALRNINKALTDYTLFNLKAQDDKSDYIDLLALKGYILEKLSRLKEAKEVYEQALIIHNIQPDVKEALVRIQKNSLVIAGNDKVPPVILLISPENARGLQVVPSGTRVEIVGKAKDPSGIATVLVNGKAITKIEEDGLFTTAVVLKQGPNTILISATDKKGNTTSKTFNLTGNAVAQQADEDIVMPAIDQSKQPQYHAILIAVNDYADYAIPDLENPVKDASELKTILESQYTFKPGNIETLYNKSREEIMQALVLKSNSLTDNDNLLIFYAGHGTAEKDKFGDVDGYWIPSSAKKGLNASYISSDDINKALKRSNSKHILVIADACFSGAFTRALSSDASMGIQKQFAVPSRKIMASGNMEPVPDNSRFIYYLKKNLKENTSKYLTAKKLFDSFYEAILNNSDTSPQYAAIKNVGDEGGEFVFIKK
ncbi:MAG: caspase family protein, partial [Pyrinomonadaceae bacterium]|nr:caspase family protein [Sphingobacteriaceae bacterium]